MFTVAFNGARADGTAVWKIFKDGREVSVEDLKHMTKEEVKEIGEATNRYRRALQR